MSQAHRYLLYASRAGLSARLLACLTLGLLVVLCWTLAHWTWVFVGAIAPAAPALAGDTGARVEPAAPIDVSAVARLFRGAQTAATPTTLNVQLVGILHARGTAMPSGAVLGVDGKPNAVFAEGREIAPATTVYRIARDHVTIRRNGALERIDFPKTAAAGGVSAAGPAFDLNVSRDNGGRFNFSRGALERALQDPTQLTQLGALSVTPGTGATIEQAPPGSLAQKLSLQPGDVVSRVNGEAVASTEDLLRLYQKFTNAGQVTLEGTRKGAPFSQTYAVNP